MNGYKSGDARARRLVRERPHDRDPDREPGRLQHLARGGRGAGRAATAAARRTRARTNETANIVAHPLRVPAQELPAAGERERATAPGPAAGVASTGVDPNRNYGAFWGGPGASGDFTNETYYGPGAFSEPETQNIRELISGRHVTTLITNHTFSDLVLRAPGLKSQGLAADEPAMKALGDSMAAENGYLSMYGWQLYDTTGTTEDWSYSATGGYGYTFEIGCVTSTGRPTSASPATSTRPSPRWSRSGRAPRRTPTRAAVTAAATARPTTRRWRTPPTRAITRCSPARRRPALLLRLKKTFETPDLEGRGARRTGIPTPSPTSSTRPTRCPRADSLSWHINPSTRPLVAQDKGRVPTGEASPPQSYPNNAPPAPAVPELPRGRADPGLLPRSRDRRSDRAGRRQRLRDRQGGVGIRRPATTTSRSTRHERQRRGRRGRADRGRLRRRAPPTSSRSRSARTRSGATSCAWSTSPRAEPYDILVTFTKPTFTPAQRENWSLSCETFGGAVLAQREVFVARGDTASVALSACAAALTARFRHGRGLRRSHRPRRAAGGSTACASAGSATCICAPTRSGASRPARASTASA